MALGILLSCQGTSPDAGRNPEKTLFRVAPENRTKAWFEAAFTGLPLDVAQTLAQKAGYRPALKTGDFMEQVGAAPGTLHRNLRYLYLDREFSKVFVARRVQVALALGGDRVTQVFYSEGLIGP